MKQFLLALIVSVATLSVAVAQPQADTVLTLTDDTVVLTAADLQNKMAVVYSPGHACKDCFRQIADYMNRRQQYDTIVIIYGQSYDIMQRRLIMRRHRNHFRQPVLIYFLPYSRAADSQPTPYVILPAGNALTYLTYRQLFDKDGTLIAF